MDKEGWKSPIPFNSPLPALPLPIYATCFAKASSEIHESRSLSSVADRVARTSSVNNTVL